MTLKFILLHVNNKIYLSSEKWTLLFNYNFFTMKKFLFDLIYLNNKYSKFIIFDNTIFIDLKIFETKEHFERYLTKFLIEFVNIQRNTERNSQIFLLEFSNRFITINSSFLYSPIGNNIDLKKTFNIYRLFFGSRYIILKIR